MDISKLKKSIPEFLKKNKLVILILFLGLVLILVPMRHTEKQETHVSEAAADPHISCKELEIILRSVKDAGRVKVLLSWDRMQSTQYQTDSEQSNTDSDAHIQSKTVVVTDASRNESGLISSIDAPQYRGAIVVCDGADNPTTRLALIDAVSNITGLRSDQIAVLKME